MSLLLLRSSTSKVRSYTTTCCCDLGGKPNKKKKKYSPSMYRKRKELFVFVLGSYFENLIKKGKQKGTLVDTLTLVERRAKDVTLLEFRLPRVLIRGGEISIVFYFFGALCGCFFWLGFCGYVACCGLLLCCCCWCCCSLGSEGSQCGRGSVGGGS